MYSSTTCSYRRHPALYFPDGNVVLSARLRSNNSASSQGYSIAHSHNSSQNSTRREVFRVHTFLLSHHSSVFADIFTGNLVYDQPDSNSYDGLPLIHLTDNSMDLSSLLMALYDPSYLPFERNNPDTPFFVAGILSLSTKYKIINLRARIIRHLEADWPQSLQDWDRLEAEVTFYRSSSQSAANSSRSSLSSPSTPTSFGASSSTCFSTAFIDDRLPEPASAIRLAQDCGVASILPASFYHLTRLHTVNDWDVYRRDIAGQYKLAAGVRTARWGLLDQADFCRLVTSRERLSKYMQGFHANALIEAADRCHGRGCAQADTRNHNHSNPRDFSQSLGHFNGRLTTPSSSPTPSSLARPPASCLGPSSRLWTLATDYACPDPLLALSRWYAPDVLEAYGVCADCRAWLRERSYREREILWARLPEMFGFRMRGGMDLA